MGVRRHGIALSQSHALGQGCPHGATNVALCRNPTDPVLSQPSSSSSSRVPTSSHPGSPYSLPPSPTPRTMPPTKYFASEGSAGKQALDPQIPHSHRNQRPPHCQARTSRQLLRHTPWCGSFHRKHGSNPLGWDCFSHSFFLRGMICRHSQFQASERPITALPICRADAQHYHHTWQKPHRRVQPDPYLHGSGLLHPLQMRGGKRLFGKRTKGQVVFREGRCTASSRRVQPETAPPTPAFGERQQHPAAALPSTAESRTGILPFPTCTQRSPASVLGINQSLLGANN